MPVQETIVERIEYRLALVLPASRKLLAISNVDGYRLPSISIPQWTRPAEQLQKAILTAWKLHVIILDFLPSSEGHPICAVAEVLPSAKLPELKSVLLERIQASQLSERQRARLTATLAGDSNTSSPFSQIGWINEAITWLESETGRKLSSESEIEQYNAGGSFSLVRFHTEDNRDYWLKATGEPNAHEPSITKCLSKHCGDYLPEIISSKPAWNAWLMSGEATKVDEMPNDPFQLFALLEDAVECMAELQMKTQGRSLDLLDAGAFDQGLDVFRNRSAELFDYLEETMCLQASTKVPRLEKRRIREIGTIFEEVCKRMGDLSICESIVHGDLNHGNIVTGAGHCQFIDWSEAYLGNPLISLQHLLLLNKAESAELRDLGNQVLKKRYLNVWIESCDPEAFREGFIYMPMLAVASALYGRGNWLRSPLRNESRLQSYARSLARHMDRAAREPELLETLCQ
jgi:Phosphotransferase enzyme family